MRTLPSLHRGAARLATLLYMAWLVWLSSRPGTGGTLPFPGADKLVHVLLYFPLGLLLHRSLSSPVLVWAIGVLFAISDEWHQSFVPGRTASIADGVADVCGLLLAGWVFHRFKQA